MARYAYAITYVEDDEADVLPVNFESAMSRHLSLPKSAASLSSAAKAEFSKRLSQGVKRGFWSIQEIDKMRALSSGAHFLPAGFVLKDPAGSASTKVRLVLDPSQAYNGRLLAPFNAESTLVSVLRKLQALPVVVVQDIETAFWRLRLAQQRQLCFLMDFEPEGGEDGQGELTAQATATSRLVAVAVLVAIMGVNQSGLFLA